jgi:hypothetical protein
MQYEEIEAPIEAGPNGEAFSVIYFTNPQKRKWLCGWEDGPRWSEDTGDAIWVRPEPARAIEERFGSYPDAGGRVGLAPREPEPNPERRLKDIVGRNYWHHVTS